MVITLNHISHIHRFKTQLCDFFEISDLEELKWLLGLKITQNQVNCTITLSQRAYVDTILERFNLMEANAAPMPMDAGATLSEGQAPAMLAQVEVMQNVPYQRAIGSLMYAATSTHPDIAFSLATLS
jgi:hypothetical protein